MLVPLLSASLVNFQGCAFIELELEMVSRVIFFAGSLLVVHFTQRMHHIHTFACGRIQTSDISSCSQPSAT